MTAMLYKFANENPEYRKASEELLEAEIALKDQLERVATLRRRLPRNTSVTDYLLQEGPAALSDGDAPIREVRLSNLFSAPGRTLVLVHFMFGGRQVEPCPMCTLWADGYDGVVPHLRQRIDFGVAVAGDVAELRRYARSRGWRNVRLLSSAGSTLKRDLGFESEDGSQLPGVSVFTRDGDGRVCHFYSSGAFMAPGHFRGMDLLSPVWNFHDLTPEGRGDWLPKRTYER